MLPKVPKGHACSLPPNSSPGASGAVESQSAHPAHQRCLPSEVLAKVVGVLQGG